MLSLPGYERIVALDHDAHHRVYRGVGDDGSAVILKTTASDVPDARALDRLRLEHALLARLGGDGIPTPRALVAHGQRLVLVLQGFRGDRLDGLIRNRPLALERFFEIALGLVDVLERLHRAQVVHRDLRPRNIVVNLTTGRLQLVEFGAASTLSREHAPPIPPEQLEGALAYLSPEQTGRMNRAVDYRADFYALGATCFEMLTGEPPFAAHDALELVHCHLARAPQAPHERRPDVPAPLSAIVLKLLAKLAEDRYQSAAGLRADLLRCQREWREAGRVAGFDLGGSDVSERFQLSQRLYGREAAAAALRAAFERVAAEGRPELLLVAGESGSGKSMLVGELHKPVAARHGHFIEGRVDPQRRDLPHSALAEALRGLVPYLLAASAARLAGWRHALRDALADDLPWLLQLVPPLQAITGPAPAPAELAPEQALHRLRRGVQHCVAVFARAEHPLVLFVDDLQRADLASLALLADLADAPAGRHLLVIGAYRSDEVVAGHPLAALRETLAQGRVRHAELALAPLQPAQIAELVTDSLHCDAAGAAELAAIVHAKTGGNPFFTGQFITALHHDQLIRFDAARRGWVWRAEELAARNFTDNVVALMLAELTRLPEATREALALAGLLGSHFTRAALSLVGEGPLIETEAALRPALELGLLTRTAGGYRFLHDRVGEAAATLTPPALRAQRHWRIACLLHDGLAPAALDEHCLAVADHFNQGADDPQARADRPHCLAGAALNLRACQQAQATTAYAAALRHGHAGLALLGPQRWQEAASLAFALQLATAKSAWLAGEFDSAGPLLDELLQRADDDLDWADAAQVAIAVSVSRHDASTALATALGGLRRLGVELPAQPTRADVLAAHAEHLALLAGQPVESLLALPRMTDRRCLAALRVLASVHAVAFFVNRDLWALQACRIVTLSQRHGLGDASIRGLAVFAFMLSSYLRDHDAAHRVGELAHELVRRSGASRDAPLVQYHRALVGSWTRPLREVIALEREALQGFVENGDRLSAGVCSHRLLMDSLMHGEPLAELETLADEFIARARQAQDAHTLAALTIRRQHIAALRGGSVASRASEALPPDAALADPTGVAAAFIAPAGAPRSEALACWFHVTRLAALCVAGDDAAGCAAARAAEPLLGAIAGLLSAHDYHCYDALCSAALYDTAEPAERPALLARLQAHAALLADWNERNPQTFAPGHLLVSAELARLAAEPLRAMALYEAALSAARAHGFVQFEGLANERAARFYRASGIASVADGYLDAARAAWARWGAEAKLRAFDAAHPQVARRAPRAGHDDAATQLDALAVVKAAQAISGPMRPEQLLRELLTIVLQQAGAQHGALLLVQGDALTLAASASGDGPAIEVTLQPAAAGAEPPPWVPMRLANYVQRSGERVLLEDARAPNPFSSDAAFGLGLARSALALPIVRQARVAGVLYLEHRGVAQAFPPGRIAIVEQLAAQAAISLESARLYAELADERRTLEAKVESRTQDLERSHGVLQTMLDGMPAMIALKDLDGRFIRHNRHYAEQLGAGGSLLGLRIGDLVDAETAARSRAQDQQVIETEQGLRHEEELPVNGGRRTFQVHKFPVRDANGAVYAVGSISIDVTELNRARIDAESAVDAKGQFLANMSHEIRTPMNAILGMAHLALRSGLNAQQQNYVQKVEHSARALLGLLNDILDFSKIEAGKLDLECRAFDLRDVFENLESVIGLQAAEKGLELMFEGAADVPHALLGDPLRLGQVLINLGNNAVKFTDRGEVRLRVEVIERDAASVLLRFSIHDTGVGMTGTELERLFRPFTQADPSTSRRYGGTGLGLAISRQLVQLLGGRIEVDSTPGRGSAFHFSARLGLQPGAAAPRATSEALRGRRLLVVDDNASARAIVLALCKRFGWHAEGVDDGWAALRAVTLAAHAGMPFDLVVIDWQMPGMDGAECAQKLATGPHGARPVLMMTAAFGRDALMKRLAALQATPAGVLAKPVTASALFDGCAVALGSSDDAATAPQRDRTAAARPAALRGRRVLLVEDNALNQELALELLRDAGMQVSVAAHGREALELLAREPFELVLMDCQMPVLDGYDTTREIRRQPAWAALPVIAMTANAMASDRLRALAAGMNDHIAKPIDVAAMYETIARWIAPRAALPVPASVPAPSPTNAPAPVASATPSGFEALSGIDAAAGLARTAGNARLYRRLLLRFRDAQGGFAAAFGAARARGDMTTATRLVHDLAGLAGTLGASALAARGLALEAACRDAREAPDSHDAPVVDARLREVLDALAPVLEGLAGLQADAPAPAASAPTAGTGPAGR